MKGKLEWSVLEILIVCQLGRKIFIKKNIVEGKDSKYYPGERDHHITDVS